MEVSITVRCVGCIGNGYNQSIYDVDVSITVRCVGCICKTAQKAARFSLVRCHYDEPTVSTLL